METEASIVRRGEASKIAGKKWDVCEIQNKGTAF
jgi:hypothetical protein